ncbi:MAG TPA: hypothetical protein VLA17_14805 [Candidatus Limnocylindria bacterium]|nr:hypothetical protein [Candidatus Limnocylindria bacterium]
MNWWSRLWAASRRAQEPDPKVQLVEGGFDLVSADDNAVISGVRWSDVSRIQTYKLDLLTTDSICLLFEFRDGRAAVQVSEEWPGFANLIKSLSRAFPSIPTDWYGVAMKPAFATNQRVLYESVPSQ